VGRGRQRGERGRPRDGHPHLAPPLALALTRRILQVSGRRAVAAGVDHPTGKGLKLDPLEFARWFEQRAERLADRWLSEVRARHTHWGANLDLLIGRFCTLLTHLLPGSFGPLREHVEPLWLQASELFGSVAAQRGLAAGEAVDEFQMLREVLIRELYADPPADGGLPLSLRDLLRLNRVVDRGVTQAAVGHADALFFALFQGSGVPEHLDAEVTTEVTDQLDAIDEEFRSVMASLRR
jgi:hypothetical protein